MFHSILGPWPCPQTLDYAWKSLPRINTLAYYEISKIVSIKSFIGLAPRLIFAKQVMNNLRTLLWKSALSQYCQDILGEYFVLNALHT